MDELGRPIAYLALPKGVPVYDRAGEQIGVVDHVLADEAVDISHGLIVNTVPRPGRHLFADADQIAELHERGVLLSVGVDDLHDPSGDPAARAAESDGISDRLHRAMEWLSGRS